MNKVIRLTDYFLLNGLNWGFTSNMRYLKVQKVSLDGGIVPKILLNKVGVWDGSA